MILDLDFFSSSFASVSLVGGGELAELLRWRRYLGGLEVSETHPYNLKICIRVLLKNRHYSSSKYKCFPEVCVFRIRKIIEINSNLQL